MTHLRHTLTDPGVPRPEIALTQDALRLSNARE
jgi:hypothetical protein